MVLGFPWNEKSSLTRATGQPILHWLPNNGAKFPEFPVSCLLLAAGPASPDMTSLMVLAKPLTTGQGLFAIGLSVHISRNPFKAIAMPFIDSDSREVRLF